MRKMFLIVLGVVAFSFMIFTPLSNIYAQAVRPFKCESEGVCRPENNFKPGEEVFASLRGFRPNTGVWIWVVTNRSWRFGNPIPEAIRILCIHVTIGPRGTYFGYIGIPQPGYAGDMIVDANQNGIFDRGDAVFGRGPRPGLRVRTPR